MSQATGYYVALEGPVNKIPIFCLRLKPVERQMKEIER